MSNPHQKLARTLARAIEDDDLEAAKAAIEAGASTIAPDLDERQLPLHRAIRQNSLDMVKLLVNHGARYEHSDYNSTPHLRNAMFLALELGHHDIALAFLGEDRIISVPEASRYAAQVASGRHGDQPAVLAALLASSQPLGLSDLREAAESAAAHGLQKMLAVFGDYGIEVNDSLSANAASEDLARLIPKQWTPTWHRQAKEQGIDYYIIHLCKAVGIGFDPKNLEQPILTGGSYDGFGWGVSAHAGLEYWRQNFEPVPAFHQATKWFVPFIEKLVDGQDFSIHEIQRHHPRRVMRSEGFVPR